MPKIVKWKNMLSTTEPFNNIGLVKVRQDNTSETWQIRITENGRPYNFSERSISQVYFNTKFSRDRVVEQRAEIIDAKKGIIQYTMNNHDMQQANPFQAAYFEFRSIDGSYVDSTQTFFYHIIPSKYQTCTDGSTYIIRLEELFKLYQDYMSKGIGDWEKFVESNREILESIDPGGKILTELIDARGDYDSLKDRLDAIDKFKEARQTISYADFGANSETKYYNYADKKYYLDKEFTKEYTHDDGIEIKACHDFANKNGYKVYNSIGHYVIKETRNIEVLFDVDLGNSVIHVDESYSGKNDGQIFTISSRNAKTTNITNIILSDALKKRLKRGVSHIPELAEFSGNICFIEDETTKVGKRFGYGSSDGYNKKDWFYIKKGGYIEGEISWEYSNISSIIIKPVDKSLLNFSGGVFYLNDRLLSSGRSDNYLYRNGILVKRSNVLIDTNCYIEQNVTESDTDANCQGFIVIENVTNVTLKGDIPARKLVYVSDADHKGGTYGLSANNVINLTLDGVVSEGELADGFWGTMGTNFIKNLVVKNCQLNRVDVHFYAHNVDILDSKIESSSIFLTGFGTLNIKHTSVRSVNFLQFRDDFGCLWDGSINISDSKWLIDGKPIETSLISFSDVKDFDHGYDYFFGDRITVNNVAIEFSENSNDTMLNLVKNTINKTLTVHPVNMPRYISISDVTVDGRDLGVDVYMHINRPDLIQVKNKEKNMYYQEKFYANILKSNASYNFTNIQTSGRLIDPSYQQESAIRMITTNNPQYTETSLLPKITITNCDNQFLSLNRARTETIIDKSKVQSLIGYFGGNGASAITITNSSIQPDLRVKAPAFQLVGNYVTYDTVTIKPVKISGIVDLENSKKFHGIWEVGDAKVFTINYGNYSNVNLDPRLINYFNTVASTQENTLRFLKEMKSSQPTNYFASNSGNGYTV